jgi:hypothetical protein
LKTGQTSKPVQIYKEKIHMKKIIVAVSVMLVALVIFGAGFVFAQSNSVSASGLLGGFGPGGMMERGGGGQVHEYVEQALADKLGMTKADLETEETKGKSLYQIALDKGIAEADITTLLTEVHKTAFALAVKDGILTQAQADSMFQNMSAAGFSYANGPMGHGGMTGNRGYQGQIHESVEQALADKLGMTKADLEAQEASGKSLSQIAIDKGIAQADVTALLTDLHKAAFAQAVKDGQLTQAQADAMLQNLSANGFDNYQGRGMGGHGGRGGKGSGGMMGGWNQQQPVP